MLDKLRTVISFLTLAGAGLLFAQITAQSQKELEHERASFLQMNRQIYARYDDPESGKVVAQEQVKLIEDKLRAAIQGAIARVLRTPNPTAADVTVAISGIQGELTFGRGDLANPPSAGANLTNAPFAEVSQLNGSQTLIVAYIILEGGMGIPDSQPFIEFYTHENG